MSTDYSLTINMSEDTVNSLRIQQNCLVAFSAVQGSDPTALPIVWFRTCNYGPTFVLQWSATFAAYTSFTKIESGRVIHLSSVRPIDVGRTLSIGRGGIGMTQAEGAAGTITFDNTTTASFTCGIEQSVDNVMAPVCAYPLSGRKSQTITPLPVVVLMFTTEPVKVGEAYGARHTHARMAMMSSSQAAVIDMSSEKDVHVDYDFNSDWSFQGTTRGWTILSSAIADTLIKEDREWELATS